MGKEYRTSIDLQKQRESVDRKDSTLRGYGLAVAVIDDIDPVAEIVQEAMSVDGVKELTADQAAAAARLLHRIQDVLRARHWGPPPAATLQFKGRIVKWQPHDSGDARVLRLTFDVDGPDAASLPALWNVGDLVADAEFRYGDRQLQLAPMPEAWEMGALLDAHDRGEHVMDQDWACPACLLDRAQRSMAEGTLEAPPATTDGDEGQEE